MILGAGQGGLTSAARLQQLQVPALIVDRNPRVGDNWRNRSVRSRFYNRNLLNLL